MCSCHSIRRGHGRKDNDPVSVAVVFLAAAVVDVLLRLHEVKDALGVVRAVKIAGKTAQESWFENAVVAKLVRGLYRETMHQDQIHIYVLALKT